jgi:hypothetical protein
MYFFIRTGKKERERKKETVHIIIFYRKQKALILKSLSNVIIRTLSFCTKNIQQSDRN